MKWEDAITEIKRRSDLVQIIGQHVRLKRAGQNWIGLCPFHNEKTPSFSVNREHGFFKCFGCGASGDVYTFIEKQSGQLFADIVKQLAESFKITIDDDLKSSTTVERTRKSKELREIAQIAQAYFEQQLEKGKFVSNSPYAYLREKRGLSEATIHEFSLGYGGASTEEFIAFLKSNDVPVHMALDLGILKQGQHGLYAFFVGRIVIPIYDAKGTLCAFGGRIWLQEQKDRPKYVNSPTSTLYDKTSTLFGLHKSMPLLRNEQPVVIVEGYFDTIAVMATGYGAVAPCGTSLTKEQVQLLKRYTSRAILCMDQDKAGEQATQRALLLLIANGFEVRLVHLPTKDPDELLQKGQLDVLKDLLIKAPDALETVVLEITRQRLMGASARVAALDKVMPFLAAIQRPMLRQQYIRFYAQAFGEESSTIEQELKRFLAKSPTISFQEPPSPPTPKASTPKMPMKIVWSPKDRLLTRLLFAQPRLLIAAPEELLEGVSQLLSLLIKQVKTIFEKKPEISLLEMLNFLVIPKDPVLIDIIRESVRHPNLIGEKEGASIIRNLRKEREIRQKKEKMVQNKQRFIELSRLGDQEGIRLLFENNAREAKELRELYQSMRETEASGTSIKVNTSPPQQPLLKEPQLAHLEQEQEEWEDDGWY